MTRIDPTGRRCRCGCGNEAEASLFVCKAGRTEEGFQIYTNADMESA